jgi:hypothetical protein
MAEVHVRRTLEVRQNTLLPVPTPQTSNIMSVFSAPMPTGAGAPIATFMPSGTPMATATGRPFGNSKGGINDGKNQSALSKGGAIALSLGLVFRA